MTGAARGVGAALAHRLAGAGMRVALLGRSAVVVDAALWFGGVRR
ncbi:hypothetical protein [Streptomyces spiramenti]